MANADDTRSSARRATWRIDVGDAVGLPGRHEVAVDVVVPREAADGESRIVLACLPGGSMSRRYFDLGVDANAGSDDEASYSFAEAMARAGFVTLAFDHLGIGASSRPEPADAGFALGVEAFARINQRALELALARLAWGDAENDLPVLHVPTTIGVGHSMGSMLTVEQQALARPHAALVLFSFTTKGLPHFLNEEQLRYANDPVRTRRDLPELVRRGFGAPFAPPPSRGTPDGQSAFGIGTGSPEAARCLRRAATDLLAAGGLLSMIPGGYRPPAEQVDVPVFVLVGDHDLHGLSALEDELPHAPEVRTLLLEDCWHCHFAANTRETIWREVPAFIHHTLSKGRPA